MSDPATDLLLATLPSRGRRLQIIVLLAAFLSGAAALGHQIIWTRRLIDLLGASSLTFSKVIGAFFLGLAAGAWLSTRMKGKKGSWWQRVAIAEFAVAMLALPALLSAQFTGLVYREMGGTDWARTVLPLLLVMPPATAMGLVLPWMLNGLKEAGSSRNTFVFLYATNTLGGLIGIGLTLLWALENWVNRRGSVDVRP